MKKTFYYYFKENMDELNLPTPRFLFDSLSRSVLTVTAIVMAIDALGTAATMAEIARATTALEKLKVAGAVLGTYYVGAVIGSIAVAAAKVAKRNLAGDPQVFLRRHKLDRPWLREEIRRSWR